MILGTNSQNGGAMASVRSQHFGRADAPEVLTKLVDCFEAALPRIGTPEVQLRSAQVVEELTEGLRQIGFTVGRVGVPAPFVAFHEGAGVALDVQAGRGVINNGFLRSLIEGSLNRRVSAVGLAVMNGYQPPSMRYPQDDYGAVLDFLRRVEASDRLVLPFDWFAVIGY